MMSLMSQVTIEPVVFLYICSTQLSGLTAQNLLLLKVCLDDTKAPMPGQSECRDEVAAQKAVTYIQTWRDEILVIGQVMFVMFAGTWSDRHSRRRKPLLYIPLFGQVLSDLLCLLNVYFWKWSPNISALAQVVPVAATGGPSCFQLGEITYMCDITSEYSRTFRIGVVFAMHYLARPLASFWFGLFYNIYGLYGLYCLCVILNTLTFMYLYLFISEKYVKEEIEKKDTKRLFDFEQVLQCIKTVLKPREGYRRAVILLSVVLAPVTGAPGGGLSAVGYFFFRYKFHWTPIEFGFYGAYVTCIIFVGTCITIGVFSRILRISDTMIGVWSQATQVIASAGYAFARTTQEIILLPLVDFMHGAGLAVVYSILSKNIAPCETAQVNSVVGIAEAIFPLINLPMYNQLYNHTFEWMPGAVFLLSAYYSAIAFALFLAAHILQKKTDLKENVIQNPG